MLPRTFLIVGVPRNIFPKARPELGFSFRFWGSGVGERSRRLATVGRGRLR